MGQGYSLNALPAGPSAIETSELSDLTFERALGGARLLRTVRARHQQGVVVVKVCQKNNPGESFKHYARALKEERRALRDIPNVLPYQRIRETPTLGVLVRQFTHSSLYDRMSTRPFLENIEKKWIAFQLLSAVRDCHAHGVFHGDIKTENVLVTSWGWVYLTDFASTFKPVYLPEDNPHEFGIYYDTSGRRTCYLAPERFYTPASKPAGPHAVQWNMDMFSVGCVIAELFTETPTFNLSQLFKYRRSEYDPTFAISSKFDDEHVRALISSMIKLDPQERWHAQDYLDEYKGKAFPLYFYQHLHTLMQEITDPSSGRRTVNDNRTNSGESDDRIDRIYNDFELLSISLGYEQVETGRANTKSRSEGDVFPLEIDLPNNRHAASATLLNKADSGTFILLNVVTSSLRSTARAASKVRACELLLAFSERVSDEAKLDRILPYVMPLLVDEPNEMVLVAALRTMTQLLALVQVTSPANASLFTQYIFPRLQSFVNSKGFKHNPIVRAAYASCLASLAQTASRFLDLMQALRADGSLPASDKAVDEDGDGRVTDYDAYDNVRHEVHDQFEGQTKMFLTDNDTGVRRAFLTSVTTLCVFFGEVRASDVILSHLNTYLNDTDWQLKCAFFKTIVGVSVYIGAASLEEFILPLMLQALSDPQEFVVEQVLRSLASIAEMGLLQRVKTWEVIDTVAVFQMHPNMWIKEAACHFVAAATTYLSLADVRILVAPLIMPYVKVLVSNCSETELLDALKKPLPRAVFDLALQWAEKVDRGSFWDKAAMSGQLMKSSMRSNIPSLQSMERGSPKVFARMPKTQEDDQWVGRLKNAGMRAEDEAKILAFREYLWRTAQRIKRGESVAVDPIYDQLISLNKLKITPQTVIFDNDAAAYTDHIKDLNAALQEATLDNEGKEVDANGATTPSINDKSAPVDSRKSILLPIPDLRRQISAQSLSSSPGSGIGLLGREFDRSKRLASTLLAGDDLRNKAIAAVGTDDATAAGSLHRPSSAGYPGSTGGSATPRTKRPETKVIQRSGHNYVGNDPTVLKLLDAVYVDNFPLNAAEFGPLVQPLKLGSAPSAAGPATGGAWKPHGKLIGLLGEHSDRVNRIAVSPDHLFFLTASNDGTVKIWDSSRFERNITHRSRATYHFDTQVRVTDICFVDSTHTFIATGSNGAVRVVKIDTYDGQGGTNFKIGRTVRDWQIPSKTTSAIEFAVCCKHVKSDNTSTLLLATNLGRILYVDLRDMSVLFELQNPVRHGMPTCFCLGRRQDWILIGTVDGVLDLWDLRFQLRLRSWAFPKAIPISRLQTYTTKKPVKRHRICVSGGTGYGEVSIWDIEKVICHEVYRPSTQGPQRIDARNYELLNLDDDRPEGLLNRTVDSSVVNASESATSERMNTVISYCGVYQDNQDAESQCPYIVTGGPDYKVRFWDNDHLESCRVVSGLSSHEALPTYTLSSLGLDTKLLSERVPDAEQADGSVIESNKVSRKPAQRKVPRFDTIRLAAQNLIEGHLDTITDVAVLELPFRIVLSADRSGQVLAYQ